MQHRLHRAGDLQRGVERPGRVAEHVAALLHGALVARSGVGADEQPGQERGAAGGRHRVPRVVEVDVGGRVARRSRAQRAVAGRGVGPAGAAQVVVDEVGVRQRPVVLIPPDVRPHHEDLHRLVAGDAVVLAPQQVVEPAQLHPGDVHRVGGAHQPEVALREPAGQRPVCPRADHQPLQPAGRVAAAGGLHPEVVGDGALEEQVEPATHVQRRRGDRRVPLTGCAGPPELVVGRVVQPVVVVVAQPGQLGHAAQRGAPVELLVAVHRSDQLHQVGRLGRAGAEPPGHLAQGQRGQRPVQVEAELEGTALVGPALVVLVGGHERGDGLQRRRSLARGQPLRRREVGAAGHAHPPGAPRLGRGPGDGVGPVGRLVEERVELALAGVPTAGVLHDHRVAGLGRAVHVEAEVQQAGQLLVVGQPGEQRRERPVAVRAVDVRGQVDPVAHRDLDVLVDDQPHGEPLSCPHRACSTPPGQPTPVGYRTGRDRQSAVGPVVRPRREPS